MTNCYFLSLFNVFNLLNSAQGPSKGLESTSPSSSLRSSSIASSSSSSSSEPYTARTPSNLSNTSTLQGRGCSYSQSYCLTSGKDNTIYSYTYCDTSKVVKPFGMYTTSTSSSLPSPYFTIKRYSVSIGSSIGFRHLSHDVDSCPSM